MINYNMKVGITFSTFDLFHAGHVKMIEEAIVRVQDDFRRNLMKRKAVIVSFYFNPIHKGHLEYFNNAQALADEIFVIINNDHQRALKCSKEFQKEDERMIIVSNFKAVDKAIFQ